jgi:hypothetical protein
MQEMVMYLNLGKLDLTTLQQQGGVDANLDLDLEQPTMHVQ